MLLPNAISASRLLLAPLFFVAYFLPAWSGAWSEATAVALIALFVLSEGSDLLDGMIARRRGIISDVGKVLDPFTDVIARLTFFICLTMSGHLHVWFLLIVTYREFGIVFLRLLLIRDGIALGARVLGKAKSFTYGLVAAVAISGVALERFGVRSSALPAIRTLALVLSAAGALLAVVSFADYVRVFLAQKRASDT